MSLFNAECCVNKDDLIKSPQIRDNNTGWALKNPSIHIWINK